MVAQLAILALEDGSIFPGTLVGSQQITCGEVVFNTAMTGYQEILTDPSYCGQLITLTASHVGNVGINERDAQASRIWAQGLIINHLSPVESNWRSELSLTAYCKQQGVPLISNIDTRHLTAHLREQGALRGCIMAGDEATAAVNAAKNAASLEGLDLAIKVTTDNAYHLGKQEAFVHIVVVDYGVKQGILDHLLARDARLTVVPATTPAADILALKPDGIVLSNGPGDPKACGYAIEAVPTLLASKIPLMGICLGYQILGIALGAQSIKMKFGHHGANHPVQDLSTQKVLVTSQNHSFAIDADSLPSTLMPTHRSLFDGSLQGFRHTSLPAIGFQGHPEANPGPQEFAFVFDQFMQLIKTRSLAMSEAQPVISG